MHCKKITFYLRKSTSKQWGNPFPFIINHCYSEILTFTCSSGEISDKYALWHFFSNCFGNPRFHRALRECPLNVDDTFEAIRVKLDADYNDLRRWGKLYAYFPEYLEGTSAHYYNIVSPISDTEYTIQKALGAMGRYDRPIVFIEVNDIPT